MYHKYIGSILKIAFDSIITNRSPWIRFPYLFSLFGWLYHLLKHTISYVAIFEIRKSVLMTFFLFDMTVE